MQNKFKKINFNLDSVARFLGFVFVIFTPVVLFAQNSTAKKGLAGFFETIRSLLADSVVPVLFALAFVYFIWGVVQYVLYPDDEGKKTKGKQYMVWGLIALTVMFSIWGLVTVLGDTFGILGSSSPAQPKLPE